MNKIVESTTSDDFLYNIFKLIISNSYINEDFDQDFDSIILTSSYDFLILFGGKLMFITKKH